MIRDFPKLFFSDFGTCDKYIPLHTHDQMEWVFVIRGHFTARCPGYATLHGEPGDVFVIPAGVEHDQEAVADGENVYAIICGLDAAAPKIISCGKDPLLTQWFRQLPLLSRDKSSEEEKRLFSKMLWERMKRSAGEKDDKVNTHPALLRAVDWIDRSFRGNCTASGAVRAAGISQSHLNMLFHHKFGCGITSFIIDTRMKCAVELLLDPYLSIEEIAERSGFSGSNYFCRIFRKKFSMTPGSYRELVRQSAAAHRDG